MTRLRSRNRQDDSGFGLVAIVGSIFTLAIFAIMAWGH